MSNYNFSPTLDGLNNVDSNSINSNTLNTDYLTVNIGSSVPTLANNTNNNNIASTSFVQSAITNGNSNLVTLNTSQTISGAKIFSNALTVIQNALNIHNLNPTASASGINICNGQTTGPITIGGHGARTGAINIATVTTANAPITIGSVTSTTQTLLLNAITSFSKLAFGITPATTSNDTSIATTAFTKNLINSNLTDAMHLSTNETVSGVKVFTSVIKSDDLEATSPSNPLYLGIHNLTGPIALGSHSDRTGTIYIGSGSTASTNIQIGASSATTTTTTSLNGITTGVTPPTNSNNTQLATTAFVNTHSANNSVTLNTSQTISGAKTFTTTVKSNTFESLNASSNLNIGSVPNTIKTVVGGNTVELVTTSSGTIRAASNIFKTECIKTHFKNAVAGVILCNGGNTYYCPIPLYYSCGNMMNTFNQAYENGFTNFVGQIAEGIVVGEPVGTGQWSQLYTANQDDLYIVNSGWGIVGYDLSDYTGTIKLNFKNTTSNPVIIRPSDGNMIQSFKIYFNNEEVLMN